MGRVCSIREVRCSYKALVYKQKRKNPLRKPRYTWENDINICIQEIEVWEYGLNSTDYE
jgi:hypothetical protein